MTFLGIMSLIFRFIGIVRWAEAVEDIIEKKKRAKDLANAPVTQTEADDDWDRYK